MSKIVSQLGNPLDRIYDKVASVIALAREGAASDPAKFRRLLVVIGLAVALLAVTEFVVGPLLTTVGDSFAWNEYSQKFEVANERAQAPAEKSALLLLAACVHRNQLFAASPRSSSQFLMLERAEQLCFGQTIGQVLLSGGEGKARELAAIYERLGFKVDESVTQAIGL